MTLSLDLEVGEGDMLGHCRSGGTSQIAAGDSAQPARHCTARHCTAQQEGKGLPSMYRGRKEKAAEGLASLQYERRRERKRVLQGRALGKVLCERSLKGVR